tara:strand:+ start:22343 stop:23080 length:738 start_codon:yes stop_codon:yes gene_type:complete
MQRHRDFIPALDNNQVDIWQLDLEAPTEKWAPYAAQLLSEEDKRKINRLIQPQHRARAVAMRVQLRLLLSSYLNVAADALRFTTGRFGKPYLDQSTIMFNASDSNDKALVAIGSSPFIGVDMEFWRPLDDMPRLVERHFTNTEKLFWRTLDAEQQETVFFDLWAAKEAFIKATGRGLGLGLARCGFSLPKTNQLLECPSEFGEPSDWSCQRLTLGERVSAAVMLKADQCRVRLYQFEAEFSPSQG